MSDEDVGGGLGGLSDSEPGTPDLNIAGFGHTQEIASPTPMGDRAQQLLVYDSEEEEPPPVIGGDGGGAGAASSATGQSRGRRESAITSSLR